jgi:hypothetical protein
MRNAKSEEDGVFDGKTGYVEEVRYILGLRTFIIKWDKERVKDPTPYEMKDLKDLTYDPKHNWHQNEKDNGKVKVERRYEAGDGSKDKLVDTNMTEKQVLRNVAQSSIITQMRNQRPIVLQEATASSAASEFAPNNATEENRRKNLNYDARTYQVNKVYGLHCYCL